MNKSWTVFVFNIKYVPNMFDFPNTQGKNRKRNKLSTIPYEVAVGVLSYYYNL